MDKKYVNEKTEDCSFAFKSLFFKYNALECGKQKTVSIVTLRRFF